MERTGRKLYEEERAGYSQSHEAVTRETPETIIHAKAILAAEERKEKAWIILKAIQQGEEETRLEDGKGKDKRGTKISLKGISLGHAEAAYAEAAEDVATLYAEADPENHSPSSPERLTLADVQALERENDVMAIRRETLEALVDFVCQGNPYTHIWDMFLNFIAFVRRVRPLALKGISETDVAVILGEGRKGRATVQAREKRVVERLQRTWGILGYQALGGTKGHSVRLALARAATGNSSRREGARRRHREQSSKKAA
ncbi:MAG: hypothetical protein AAF191_08945 [Verrucomicrobiota bacterium]